MHFIAASFNWSVAGGEGSSGLATGADRRLSAASAPDTHSTRAGPVIVAGAASAVAAAGDIEVVLVNCEARDDAQIAGLAAALAGSWTDRGRAAFAELHGVYQAVIVDAGRRQVSLAVDRFAIGQLFYTTADGSLLVSSDLTALMADPRVLRTIDQQAVYDYVFFHCIPAPRTIFQDVRKLEPAGVVDWRDGRISSATSWQPTFAVPGAAAPPPQALLEPLENAVSARSHGKVGAFLSGGLDSSSVAGMLSRHVQPTPTFTIGFSAREYDESAFAQVSAQHFSTDHHEYFVTPADIVEAWPRIATFYAEPFGNSSVIPTYYCARFARENGIEVLLAGDGGDELFGGNERYVTQDVFERYFRLPGWLRAALETGYRIAPVLGRLPIAGKGQRYIEQARMGLPDRLQSYNFLNRFELARVFDADWLAAVDTQAPWTAWRERYAAAGDADPLHAMLFLDWKFTLADNDLVKVSTMCELAGMDVRYPMLDHELIDFARQVPAAAMNPGGRLRGYYKDATRGFLPQAVLDKSKHGFGLPFGVWMRDDPALNDLAESALLDFGRRGIIRPDFIDEAIRLLRSDAPGYYGELIWITVTLELWLREHG